MINKTSTTSVLLLHIILSLFTGSNAFRNLPLKRSATQEATTSTTTSTRAPFCLSEPSRTVVPPKSWSHKKQNVILYQSDQVMERTTSTSAANRIRQYIPTAPDHWKRFFPLPSQVLTTSTHSATSTQSTSTTSTQSSTAAATQPFLSRSAKEHVSGASALLLQRMKRLINESWWTSPMWLCLVPVWMNWVHGQPALTPAFWKMTNMQGMWHASNQSVTFFLFSNIVYFIAGWYLITKYSAVTTNYSDNHRHPQDGTTPHFQPTTTRPTSAKSSLTNEGQQHQQKPLSFFLLPRTPRFIFTKYTALGLWVGLAGLVSTVFHAFQATCSIAAAPSTAAGHALSAATASATIAAESWCYIDHGIAGTAILYFWHVCGAPYKPTNNNNTTNRLRASSGRSVVALSALGFLALITPHAYTYMHATWHLLSAGAAVCWGLQPLKETQQQQEQQHY